MQKQAIELPDRHLALVLVLVAAIIYITGTFTGVDWAVLFHGFESEYSPYARYMRTLLCAMLAFAVGRHWLDLRDHMFLWVAFALTCVADLFLILLDKFIIGVAVFLVVHVTLSIRHAQGWRASMRGPDKAEVKRWLLLSFIGVFGPGGVMIWLATPALRKSGLMGLDYVYMVVLMISCWMGWGTLIRSFYPRLNAWCIALGMTFFFLCDVSLGLSHVYADLHPLFAKAMGMVPDMTYSTALTLLALSGYRWYAEEGDWERDEPYPSVTP